MRIVQSTWIRPTANESERRRAGNIVTMQRRFENVIVASSPKKRKFKSIELRKVSRHNIEIMHDLDRMLNRHPRFLEIHCRRGGRSRGRKSHLTRSFVASEGWLLVRDRTNRKHCPSHNIWSYTTNKRDGRWCGWSFDRGSTAFNNSWYPANLMSLSNVFSTFFTETFEKTF